MSPVTILKAESPHIERRPLPQDSPAKRPALALVLAAFAAVYLIWGSTYLAIKLAIASFPPLLMSGARFLLAGAFLYTVMRAVGAQRPTPFLWRNATIGGALLLLIGNGGVSWAEQTVPTNMAALLIAATPLWIILIDWLRPTGQRPRALLFAGLGIGFVGVALMIAGRNELGHAIVDPIGAVILLVASVAWAFGSIFSRHARQSPSALLAVAMQMISGGLLLMVGGFAIGEWEAFEVAAVTRSSLLAFVYLTIFGSLVGFTAYVWLLQVSTPARVATYAYVNPFIAVILGWLILDEALPRSALLAAFLIIVAVVLITTNARRVDS